MRQKAADIKVLNVSANDEMGARFNGFDIQPRLLELGVDSRLTVFWNKTSDKNWVTVAFPGILRRMLAELIRGLEVSTGRQSTFQWWSLKILKLSEFKNSDLVHLQVVHDHFFRLEAISKVVRAKPTLWTWHDLWPVTGHCIFPVECSRWQLGCGNCPDLMAPLPVFHDRTKQEYQRKQRFLQANSLDIHVTTKWMENHVKQHVQNPNIRFHVFPFGIDLDSFSPGTSTAIRSKLGIRKDTIVFFARATDDLRKGFIPLVQALDKLSFEFDITLITVQSQGLSAKHSKNLKIIEYPWTNNPSHLIDLYRAADMFCMPSVGESFGMMALEAMACGKPVLTVRGTATAEVVGSPETEIGNVNLKLGIYRKLKTLLQEPEMFESMGLKARQRAEEEYSLELYLTNLRITYEKLMADHVA